MNLFLITFVLFLVFSVQTSFAQKEQCEAQYKHIEKSIRDSNYCGSNKDCAVLELGGQYVAFGCYHFINKGVDKEIIYKQMEIYYKSCLAAIDDCAQAPEPVCINKKCVEVPEKTK